MDRDAILVRSGLKWPILYVYHICFTFKLLPVVFYQLYFNQQALCHTIVLVFKIFFCESKVCPLQDNKRSTKVQRIHSTQNLIFRFFKFQKKLIAPFVHQSIED
jgi:hypothetical protein